MSSWKQGRNSDFVFFFEKRCQKKAIVSFPTRPDWGRQMLQKNGQHSVPRQPPSEGGLRGIPPRRTGLAGLARLRSCPVFLESFPVPRGPARSFIGGGGLLITPPLSPEQSGTSSASLDRRTETRASPRKRGSSTLAPAQRAH